MAKSNAGESEIETDSGEVDEIVFAYFTQNNIPETSELQRIEDLLNEYTVEKINTKVHLAVFSPTASAQGNCRYQSCHE